MSFCIASSYVNIDVNVFYLQNLDGCKEFLADLWIS